MSAAPGFVGVWYVEVDAVASRSALQEAGLEAELVTIETREKGQVVATAWELYVPPTDVAAALQVLEEAPVLMAVLPGVSDTRTGATVCELHGAAMDAPCQRCGTFVCRACVGEGPAMCDDCDALAWESERQKSDRRSTRHATVAGLVIGSVLLAALWLRFFG